MDCIWIICYEWVIFTGLCVLCIGTERGGKPCSVNIWLRVSLWLAVSIVWSLWRAAGMLSRVCQQFRDEQKLIEADVLHYWICHLYHCFKIFNLRAEISWHVVSWKQLLVTGFHIWRVVLGCWVGKVALEKSTCSWPYLRCLKASL